MDKQNQGKIIVSAAKTLKGYRLDDSRIATFLYAISDAGRFGLFASAIKSEYQAGITRIRFLAGEEGIGFHNLTSEVLPWLERAGLCQLVRDATGDIAQVSSLVLAYRDLLGAVADYYSSRNPSQEDRACLMVLAQASELPNPESVIRHVVANEFGEETANAAVGLAKTYGLVAASGITSDPLLYAPRVWAGLHARAPRALAPLDTTQREVLLHLVGRVRNSQGYPETLLNNEATEHGAKDLLRMAIGIGLVNRTELQMADGTKRAFLTTPHFYSDLADEYGEDMCDRVKIFLDSIRNGQYFGRQATGRIRDPRVLLGALLDRGQVGPATAINTDYIVAEKAGIIRVEREAFSNKAFLEVKQEDTVRKVFELVSSGTVEPRAQQMGANHMLDGRVFTSIEQGRAELGNVSGDLAELEHAIMTGLREG